MRRAHCCAESGQFPCWTPSHTPHTPYTVSATDTDTDSDWIEEEDAELPAQLLERLAASTDPQLKRSVNQAADGAGLEPPGGEGLRRGAGHAWLRRRSTTGAGTRLTGRARWRKQCWGLGCGSTTCIGGRCCLQVLLWCGQMYSRGAEAAGSAPAASTAAQPALLMTSSPLPGAVTTSSHRRRTASPPRVAVSHM
jgi:hypothetical protein